jgi:hypothetical protein
VRRRRAPARNEDWLDRLDEVRETGDRRASAALLRAFFAPEIGDARRAEIAVALRALEDVRCAARSSTSTCRRTSEASRSRSTP